MKKSVGLSLMALVVFGVLAGCGKGVAPAGTVEDMAVMAMTGDAAQAFDLPAQAFDLEGRIVGLDRVGLAGVAVSLCLNTCRDTMTGAQGEFLFAGVAADSFFTLHARKIGAADYADLDFPLYLSSGSNPHLLPLVLPRVGAGTAVAPGKQILPIDGTLALSIDGAALALPQGGAVSRLAGVRITSDLFPNFCVPSARVLAMWAFAPTGVSSSLPVTVSLSEGLGLPPGTLVSFIEIDPKNGRPFTVATGSVAMDGKSIQTEMASGLQRLGWLLLAVVQGGA